MSFEATMAVAESLKRTFGRRAPEAAWKVLALVPGWLQAQIDARVISSPVWETILKSEQP
jgi:hypothetical protein